VEWHLSFPLMNNFNKTEAAIFPCRLYFLRAFPFIGLMITEQKNEVNELAHRQEMERVSVEHRLEMEMAEATEQRDRLLAQEMGALQVCIVRPAPRPGDGRTTGVYS